MKKILIIITNMDFGGAQKVFYQQSLLLSQFYEVTECVFNKLDGNAFPTGNKLVSLEVKAGVCLLDKIFRFFQRVIRLKRLKKEMGIDISISHLEGADLVNILSRGKDRTITWVHGSKAHDQNISGVLGFVRHKILIPFIYSRADKVATVSLAIMQELIDHYRIGRASISVINNYFDIDNIRAKALEPMPDNFSAIYDGLPVLIFSGRLAKEKNLKSLLEWFSIFTQQYPSKLVILGDGELRDQLLNYCKVIRLATYHPWANLDLKDVYEVYFLGYQSNPHVLVKSANIFLLPSLWEGFPMALGEAMACGITVASADCPAGHRELIMKNSQVSKKFQFPVFGEFGVLLPMLTTNHYLVWTRAMITILRDKNLLREYGRKAEERSMYYSKNRNEKETIDLILTV